MSSLPTCKQCGVNQVKRVGKTYCSRKCYYVTRKGSNNNKWKGGSFTFNCKACLKEFKVDRDRADAKTCSRKCNAIYRKTEEFRNNLSVIQRAKFPEGTLFARTFTSLLRTCSRYAQWREKVLKRDNFTCQSCDKRGGKLQVDHIEPFISILKRNGVVSVDDAFRCEELWNVENGQTLCLPCHYKTDTFGAKALKTLTFN